MKMLIAYDVRIAMKNIEQSHIALLIRMATEAVAGAARVQWQWQQGTAGRWWRAGQPLQVGRGQGDAVLKFY